jgi:hypothetical protein
LSNLKARHEPVMKDPAQASKTASQRRAAP